jgi:hypothetical protein
MLILTLVLGWLVYRYAARIGGPAGGLLCLAAYVTTPAFLAFGPLVHSDLPVTLFSLIALWRLGEIWDAPSPGNARLFGAAFAAALLSKFTGLLLIPVVLVLFLQTRFWPSAGEPAGKAARKAWRSVRWRCVLRGALYAGALVYIVYFVFSWNQPDDALNRIGHGSWAWLVRRPLMPLWLYLRGILMMLVMGSRPTFLLGRTYSHGVPYYFPVVFALKSTLGFLALLAAAAVAGILNRKRRGRAIPEEVRSHWRALITGFFVYLVVCLLSLLDISIRHFMMPIALLILMLAPVPRMVGALPGRRIWLTAVAAAAVSCFVPIALAYPYFLPYVNGLAFGHPAYSLMNDSNVSWNEGLPEVERFARERHLTEIALDWASISDAALVVPQARMWDCQTPTDRDAGQWVAVAAVSILENRNCGYLRQYPRRQLAGGGFYVFQLPAPIPPPGSPGGPPAASECRIMWGLPFDFRAWAVNAERHPELLPAEMGKLMQRFQEQGQRQQAAGKKQ